MYLLEKYIHIIHLFLGVKLDSDTKYPPILGVLVVHRKTWSLKFHLFFCKEKKGVFLMYFFSTFFILHLFFHTFFFVYRKKKKPQKYSSHTSSCCIKTTEILCVSRFVSFHNIQLACFCCCHVALPCCCTYIR